MTPIKIKTKLNAYTKASLLDLDSTNNIVHVIEGNIKGDGTESNPLDLVYVPDEKTIIKTNEGTKISAIALLDENYEDFPQDEPVDGKLVLPNPISASSIREKFNEVDSILDKNSQDIVNVYQTLENEHNTLLNKLSNLGGYLPAHTFGEIIDTDIITQYALDYLKIKDPNLIPNQTRVKNLTDDHVWILNNMERDGQAVFEWVDDGSDSIGVATLNTLGLIASSNNKHEGFINTQGHLTINGLEEDLTNLNQRISSEFDEVNSLTGEVSDLKQIHFTQEQGNEQVTVEVNNLVQAIANHNDRINSNFDELNLLTEEISDFKQLYINDSNNINDNFNTITNKVKENTQNLESLTQTVSSNFDEINNNIGDIFDLQSTVTNQDNKVSNIVEVLADHKERIIDNFDNINQLISEVSDIKESTKNFVDLTSEQTITGEKTFTGFNLQVPGAVPIQVQAVENGDLSIKQIKPDAGTSIILQSNATGETPSLTLATTKGSNSTRVDITDTNLEINSSEFLYNGVRVATIDDVPVEVGNLIEANGFMVHLDLDNTTLASNIQDILGKTNNQNGGSLISISFKTGLDPVAGDVINITEQVINESTEEGGTTIETLSGQPILAPNSFYYIYPEQISTLDNKVSIYFGCKTNFPYGKGIINITATKNTSTGLFENATATISGEAFYTRNGIVYRYYFQDVDILKLPLAHLTINFIQYPD